MISTRDGTLTLADGRSLGYLELGPSDGYPVMYNHGFPSCRLEPTVSAPLLTQVAEPLRIIALDRPGYGLSDFVAGRTFADWPRDVAAAADLLGIDHFSVIGASGGAPYALATAASLGDRVDRVGIVVGIAPPEAPGIADSPAITGPGTNLLQRRIEFGMLSLALKMMRQFGLLRSMKLLSRARLFLFQSNFGLAEQDVQIARDLLSEIAADYPETDAALMNEVIFRLDRTLDQLPEWPVTAADDLDIAWSVLLGDTQPPGTPAEENPDT